jgi:hypothetical protein
MCARSDGWQRARKSKRHASVLARSKSWRGFAEKMKNNSKNFGIWKGLFVWVFNNIFGCFGHQSWTIGVVFDFYEAGEG